ncbi:MAG TPA: hypothetical protein VF233_01105 [Nitrososphaeraceae archaeon]
MMPAAATTTTTTAVVAIVLATSFREIPVTFIIISLSVLNFLSIISVRDYLQDKIGMEDFNDN